MSDEWSVATGLALSESASVLSATCSSLITHHFLIRLAAHEHGDGSQHDAQVEPERPVLYVEEVEPDHLVEREAVAPRHLPQARHPRLHVETLAVPKLVRLHLVRNRRARADDAHVSAQHVQELRQLVQTRAPQPPSRARDARVLVELV